MSSPLNKFKISNPITDFGDYTMKIGKHKGKSITELLEMEGGKQYLIWFHDNVINEENMKFYGKIIKVVEALVGKDQLKQKV